MTAIKKLDLKGVPCPMNIVKINLALEKLSYHEELIVELNKGEPEEMIFKNLKEMGYYYSQIQDSKNFIKIKILNENSQ